MTVLDRLRVRLPEEENTWVLMEVLEAAKERIMESVYPFEEWPEELPARYTGSQLDIAVELYGKRGAEGQTGHSENSISRTWKNADISDDLMQRLTPRVGRLR